MCIIEEMKKLVRMFLIRGHRYILSKICMNPYENDLRGLFCVLPQDLSNKKP